MDTRKLTKEFLALAAVMSRLRRECPWDRRQTHESLRRYLVEECHEVLEALDDGDADGLRAELGDLLFQIWFHAEVASEAVGGFDLIDVVRGVREKLIRRHPHVFGDARADDAAAVKRSWEALKQAEGRESRLDGVPRELPALLAAQCLQEKAASVGFDWPDADGVLAKVREEIEELVVEVECGARDGATDEVRRATEHELGDLMFALVNLARHLGLNGEDALRGANRRFSSRFRHIEERAGASGRRIEDLDLAEMDRLWDEAKRRG